MKIKGIKKAVTESIKNINSGLFSRTYFDTETLEVWTTEFVNANSWIELTDSTVVCIGTGIMTMQDIKETIENIFNKEK